MNIMDLVEELTTRTTCSGIARTLRKIVHAVLMSDPITWENVLNRIINAVKPVGFERFNSRGPYYIATGMEANYMLIDFELSTAFSSEPRQAIAKLEYLASRFEKANDTPISTVEHLVEIFEYCEREFKCLSRSNTIDHVIIMLPDADIGCVAESVQWSEKTLVMAINEKNSPFRLIEMFGYELAALIFAEDTPPKSAVDLLAQTTVPDIKEYDEDGRYWEYLQALKMGMCYQGPFSKQIEIPPDNMKYQRLWKEYVRSIVAQRE